MNLRNKKTGEAGYYLHTHRDYNTDTLKVAVLKDGVPFSEFKPHEPIYDYDSLAELNSDWEDYVPKEPLIKDEKIRKAVRAWAEANGFLDEIEVSSLTAGTRFSIENYDIEFLGYFIYDLEYNKTFTIAELCGEEEE